MRLYALAALEVTCLAACDDAVDPGWDGEPGVATEAVIHAWNPLVEVKPGPFEARDFVLDTGAPLTHLDTRTYPIEDTLYGDVEAFGLRFLDRQLVPIDLFRDKSLALYKVCLGLRPAGLLGGDVLRSFVFVGDYLAGRVYVFDGLDGDLPSDVRLDRELRVPVRVRGGVPATRVVVETEVEGRVVNMLLDTGASFVSISPSLLREAGEEGRPFLSDIPVKTAEGRVVTSITRLARVAVGDAAVESVPTVVLADDDLLAAVSDEAGLGGDAALRGLLGGTFLREFVFAVDYPGEELRLARYVSPDHVDRREFVGPGFELERCERRFWVFGFYADAGVDWEAADVRFGDAVIAVGGRPLAGLSLAEVHSLYRTLPPGSVVTFTFNRDPGVRDSTRRDGDVDLEILDLLPDYR